MKMIFFSLLLLIFMLFFLSAPAVIVNNGSSKDVQLEIEIKSLNGKRSYEKHFLKRGGTFTHQNCISLSVLCPAIDFIRSLKHVKSDTVVSLVNENDTIAVYSTVKVYSKCRSNL